MTPSERLFRENSPNRLQVPSFVLELESQMLLPTPQRRSLRPYLTLLALNAGPFSNPDEENLFEPDPPQWPIPGHYDLNGYPIAPIMPNRSPVDSRPWGYSALPNGDLDWEKYVPPAPLSLGIFDIDLKKREILRTYRMAFEQSKNLEAESKKIIRNSIIEGQIAAMGLDMRRLLLGLSLKTKKGRTIQSSKNIAAYVCERHNLGRTKRRPGRPEKENNEYRVLNKDGVKDIFRDYADCTALWAAYRALSSHPFDSIPHTHLLQGLDANEFFRLFMAYEEERRAFESPRPRQTLIALGPQDQYDELRALLEKHAPTYSADE